MDTEADIESIERAAMDAHARGEPARVVEKLGPLSAGRRICRQSRLVLAQARYRLADLDAAVADCMALAREDPVDLEPLRLLALAYAARGRIDLAASMVRRLLMLTPADVGAQAKLMNLMTGAAPSRLVGFARRAATLRPAEAVGLTALAESLSVDAETRSAAHALARRAVLLDPSRARDAADDRDPCPDR